MKAALTVATDEQKIEIYEHLDNLTKYIQKTQRETGKSFVSRTRLTPEVYQHQPTIVFRVVLANPLTTKEILQNVLIEQREIASSSEISLPLLNQIVDKILR